MKPKRVSAASAIDMAPVAGPSDWFARRQRDEAAAAQGGERSGKRAKRRSPISAPNTGLKRQRTHSSSVPSRSPYPSASPSLSQSQQVPQYARRERESPLKISILDSSPGYRSSSSPDPLQMMPVPRKVGAATSAGLVKVRQSLGESSRTPSRPLSSARPSPRSSLVKKRREPRAQDVIVVSDEEVDAVERPRRPSPARPNLPKRRPPGKGRLPSSSGSPPPEYIEPIKAARDPDPPRLPQPAPKKPANVRPLKRKAVDDLDEALLSRTRSLSPDFPPADPIPDPLQRRVVQKTKKQAAPGKRRGIASEQDAKPPEPVEVLEPEKEKELELPEQELEPEALDEIQPEVEQDIEQEVEPEVEQEPEPVTEWEMDPGVDDVFDPEPVAAIEVPEEVTTAALLDEEREALDRLAERPSPIALPVDAAEAGPAIEAPSPVVAVRDIDAAFVLDSIPPIQPVILATKDQTPPQPPKAVSSENDEKLDESMSKPSQEPGAVSDETREVEPMPMEEAELEPAVGAVSDQDGVEVIDKAPKVLAVSSPKEEPLLAVEPAVEPLLVKPSPTKTPSRATPRKQPRRSTRASASKPTLPPSIAGRPEPATPSTRPQRRRGVPNQPSPPEARASQLLPAPPTRAVIELSVSPEIVAGPPLRAKLSITPETQASEQLPPPASTPLASPSSVGSRKKLMPSPAVHPTPSPAVQPTPTSPTAPPRTRTVVEVVVPRPPQPSLSKTPAAPETRARAPAQLPDEVSVAPVVLSPSVTPVLPAPVVMLESEPETPALDVEQSADDVPASQGAAEAVTAEVEVEFENDTSSDVFIDALVDPASTEGSPSPELRKAPLGEITQRMEAIPTKRSASPVAESTPEAKHPAARSTSATRAAASLQEAASSATPLTIATKADHLEEASKPADLESEEPKAIVNTTLSTSVETVPGEDVVPPVDTEDKRGSPGALGLDVGTAKVESSAIVPSAGNGPDELDEMLQYLHEDAFADEASKGRTSPLSPMSKLIKERDEAEAQFEREKQLRGESQRVNGASRPTVPVSALDLPMPAVSPSEHAKPIVAALEAAVARAQAVQPAKIEKRARRSNAGTTANAREVEKMVSDWLERMNEPDEPPPGTLPLLLTTQPLASVPTTHAVAFQEDVKPATAASSSQSQIETPDWTVVKPGFDDEEDSGVVGVSPSKLRHRPNVEVTEDTSDEHYALAHKRYEAFEKRQRSREKEKLNFERHLMRTKLDILKGMPQNSWQAIVNGVLSRVEHTEDGVSGSATPSVGEQMIQTHGISWLKSRLIIEGQELLERYDQLLPVESRQKRQTPASHSLPITSPSPSVLPSRVNALREATPSNKKAALSITPAPTKSRTTAGRRQSLRETNNPTPARPSRASSAVSDGDPPSFEETTAAKAQASLKQRAAAAAARSIQEEDFIPITTASGLPCIVEAANRRLATTLEHEAAKASGKTMGPQRTSSRSAQILPFGAAPPAILGWKMNYDLDGPFWWDMLEERRVMREAEATEGGKVEGFSIASNIASA